MAIIVVGEGDTSNRVMFPTAYGTNAPVIFVDGPRATHEPEQRVRARWPLVNYVRPVSADAAKAHARAEASRAAARAAERGAFRRQPAGHRTQARWRSRWCSPR